VGPIEGSIGSFGRCGVSSSLRIMLLDRLQGWGGRELEEIGSIMVLHLVLFGNYVVRSRWRCKADHGCVGEICLITLPSVPALSRTG